ncbi:flavin reductase [Alteromonas sp. 1_MG-2023]|uniref:flavin reductase family protein n=1 Tax=Alteromonas sp. 1_MG-2023 TaxID=3062669 RepID=UPI0026E42018|nr:flavin reductase [Alteromonas sp. 1_MG-2023]MDO6566914.1 flavin reductase [Alteromonas sp. 1_MG-2023]
MPSSGTHFSLQDIEALPERYRANFINSLSGFKSASLLGSTDGRSNNLAIISSVVHVGANPPLLGIIMRPHTVQRDSLSNIKQQGNFTLNHVHTSWTDKAHQTSARYENGVSEFEEVGLTPWFSDTFSAPYVKESAVNIGLKVEQHFTLCNQTEMVIGEIQEVFIKGSNISERAVSGNRITVNGASGFSAVESVIAENGFVDENGYVDIESLHTACVSGLDSYHSTQKIAQYPYAKPKT